MLSRDEYFLFVFGEQMLYNFFSVLNVVSGVANLTQTSLIEGVVPRLDGII